MFLRFCFQAGHAALFSATVHPKTTAAATTATAAARAITATITAHVWHAFSQHICQNGHGVSAIRIRHVAPPSRRARVAGKRERE